MGVRPFLQKLPSWLCCTSRRDIKPKCFCRNYQQWPQDKVSRGVITRQKVTGTPITQDVENPPFVEHVPRAAMVTRSLLVCLPGIKSHQLLAGHRCHSTHEAFGLGSGEEMIGFTKGTWENGRKKVVQLWKYWENARYSINMVPQRWEWGRLVYRFFDVVPFLQMCRTTRAKSMWFWGDCIGLVSSVATS